MGVDDSAKADHACFADSTDVFKHAVAPRSHNGSGKATSPWPDLSVNLDLSEGWP